ncbi:hypothetical protein [Sagittula stellata]|nr:hypothetical protein [Sagittula stellata]
MEREVEMLDVVLVLIALATGGGGAGPERETLTLTPAEAPVAASSSEEAPPPVASSEETPAALPYEAEPQVATGRFLTALEIKPIMGATRANWVAVREWDGQDLIYVTHIWSWRCGLAAMKLGVNGAAPEDWPLPPCHEDTAQPNAMLESDGLPYRAFPLKSVETVTVELIYDDLTTERSTFNRQGVLMP